MGAPATSVFLSHNLNHQQRDDIRNLCARLGVVLKHQGQAIFFHMHTSMPLGEDWPFTSEQAPAPSLSVHFASLTDEYTPDELRQISQATAFPIRSRLDVVAYTNRKTSHFALGMLTLHLARTYQGLIDLGGTLEDEHYTVWHQIPEDADDQQILDLYAAYFKNHPGKLWTVSFDEEGYRSGFNHYCNAEFLAWWLKQPHFRMVK